MTIEEKTIKELREQKLSETEEKNYKGLLKMFLEVCISINCFIFVSAISVVNRRNNY